MTWEELVALASTLPEVSEGTSYGTPGLKVRGKFLTRLRPEDDSIVLMEVGFDEREMLLAADPETFHITPHYQNYPSVLARLAALDAPTAMGFLQRRWRAVAPKTVVRRYDAERSPPPGA